MTKRTKRNPKRKPASTRAKAARASLAKATVDRGAMSEAEAARACASMFVRKGIPEGDGPGEFEITDVNFDDDGEYFATMIVRVGNLDVEMASTGDHMDQVEIDAIRTENSERTKP